MVISVKLPTKKGLIIYALGSSESKPFQSRSKGEILGQARKKERLSRSELNQAFLTDSDAELFVYLIQCIRFGVMKSSVSEPGLSVTCFFKAAVFLTIRHSMLCKRQTHKPSRKKMEIF